MNRDEQPLHACIEAGGTKFVCGVAADDGAWLDRCRIPTTDPASTFDSVEKYFLGAQERHGSITSFGIASFGPIELNRTSERWGEILETPKRDWSGASLVNYLARSFSVPIGLDTDVNAAAMAEASARAPITGNLVYVTVGTGIGGGAVVGGLPVHGRGHPEMGHIKPPRHCLDTEFAGTCPFHGDCTEGLASGPAIIARWGKPLSDLPHDHPAHDVIAWYLGHLASTVIAVLAPEHIVFGGGVLNTPGLLHKVRERAGWFAGGYLVSNDALASLIQPPLFGEDAGLQGALLLAKLATREDRDAMSMT